MILEHISKGAAFIVVACSMLNVAGFCYCNLYVVDVIAVPDGLENSIRKPEHQNILNGLLTKIMVYAVDLRFVKTPVDFVIQFNGTLQVFAEWFFDDQLNLLLRLELFRTSYSCRGKMFYYRSV